MEDRREEYLRRTKRLGVWALLVVILVSGIIALLWNRHQLQRGEDLYAGVGGEFRLLSKDGAVSLSDYRGRVVLVFFGYTHCPDICPNSLGAMAAAFRRLSTDEVGDVWGIFISVGPGRDTPEQVG